MTRYHLPPSGELDPVESLHHYTENYLSSLRKGLEKGARPNWITARTVLSGILRGFGDGNYTYQYSQAFNPEIARSLSAEVKRVVKRGASPDTLKGLEEKLLQTADEHAIQAGQPHRTRAAVNSTIDELRAGKRSK